MFMNRAGGCYFDVWGEERGLEFFIHFFFLEISMFLKEELGILHWKWRIMLWLNN